MRVSGKSSSVGSTPGVGASSGASKVQGPVAVAATGGVSDALSVSSAAQLVAVAQAELARVPDVRTEKVEALRAALDSDRYNPDGEAVADGLIREHSPVRRDP